MGSAEGRRRKREGQGSLSPTSSTSVDVLERIMRSGWQAAWRIRVIRVKILESVKSREVSPTRDR